MHQMEITNESIYLKWNVANTFSTRKKKRNHREIITWNWKVRTKQQNLVTYNNKKERFNRRFLFDVCDMLSMCIK